MKLSNLVASKNLAMDMDEAQLDLIGLQVLDNYLADEESRKEWKNNNVDAYKLALQIVEEKSTPWENASNVKFPLLTIAAIQFAARAYPALVKAPDLVKFRVQGRDEDGLKSARAARVSSHMSYQLLEEDEEWEEGQDKAYMALPITGSVFKKTYYDPVKKKNCSELVLPQDLCVHYYGNGVERKTHIIPMSERVIREKVLAKVYKQYDLPEASQPEPSEADQRQGITPPAVDVDRTLLEQHAYLDLDEDGYKEPYVITVDEDTGKVFRIVHRFAEVVTEQSVQMQTNQQRIKELVDATPPEGDLVTIQRVETTVKALVEQNKALAAEKPKVLRIAPVEYFTKIPFIPSPDGGFYDIGFGALLSPLNDSVNTLINQLVDSGSLNNSSMGFLGKGSRLKGGKLKFSPFEWKQVQVAGGTLRDNMVPLPVNPPSAVLFQLLGLLISYTERVSSVTDTMTGDNPGQNTPAYNMSAMLEQGLQVFNGIFKRVYRSFRAELRALYRLNGQYLDVENYYEYQDGDQTVLQSDYQGDPKDLIPAADPNAFSSKEKQGKAELIAQRAAMVPGYDPIKVEQRFLEAMDIPDAAEIFPTTQGEEGQTQLVFPPGPDPEFEIKRMEEERRTLEAQDRAKINYMELEGKLAVMEAEILLKTAQAEVAADSLEFKRIEALMEDMRHKREMLLEMAKIEETKKAPPSASGGT